MSCVGIVAQMKNRAQEKKWFIIKALCEAQNTRYATTKFAHRIIRIYVRSAYIDYLSMVALVSTIADFFRFGASG